MKIKELRKLTKKELEEYKKKCELLISSSYAKVKPAIKPEQRASLKRTVAQINTLLREK